MNITEITDQHLLNRIAYFERFLETKPEEQYYVGDNDVASKSVELENEHNERLAKEIEAHIKQMKKEAKKRGLK